MSEKITELVAALIVKDGLVLLVHNIKHGRRVEPPGGKREFGENPEQTVVRECMEELAVAVEIDHKVGIYHTHSPEGVFNVHTYRCRIVDGDPILNEPHKFDKLEYYNFEELLELKEQGILVPNLANNLYSLRPHLE